MSDKNIITYSIDTEIIDSKIILIEKMNGEILNRHVKEIMDTKDKATRQGLIALGWTPPKEDTL